MKTINIYRTNGWRRGPKVATVMAEAVMSHSTTVSFWFNGEALDVTIEDWQDYKLSDSSGGLILSIMDVR